MDVSREAVALPFPERVWMGIEALRMRYEARDGFLSDDDVLDAADAWTVSVRDADEDSETGWIDGDDADYRKLVDTLFGVVFEEGEV